MVGNLFCKCNICDKVICIITEGSPATVCCGERMTVLEPNTVEASHEKHIPKLELDGSTLKVTIGEVLHPMTKEHHIAWIAVIEDGMKQQAILDPEGEPTHCFELSSGSAAVYAYCNLHGLWKAEIWH